MFYISSKVYQHMMAHTGEFVISCGIVGTYRVEEDATDIMKTSWNSVQECRQCGKELPSCDFYLNKRTSSGLSNYCKKCHTVRKRLWRAQIKAA